MLNNNDEIENLLVKQKIDLIVNMLVELSKQHDFSFIFHYTHLGSKHQILNTHTLFNQNLHQYALHMCLQDLVNYKNEQEYVAKLISQGRIIVQCVNDSDQSVDVVDRVTKWRFYEVEHIYTNIHKEINIFKLHGMNPGDKNIGYNSKRFVQLFNIYSHN